MRRLLWLMVMLGLGALPASAAVDGLNGFCMTGGKPVVTSGLNSTTTVQQSYPRCTVTVFLTGTTTKATIYRDAISTPLANPFVANSDASWLFFATTGVGYDVTMTGGTAPNVFPIPQTLTDLKVGGGGGSSTVVEVNGTPLITQSPVNFVNAGGVTWTNPSAGVINAAASGTGCSTAGIAAGNLLFPDSSGNCVGSDNITANATTGGAEGADGIILKTSSTHTGNDFNLELHSAVAPTHNESDFAPQLWKMLCNNAGTSSLGCAIQLDVADWGRPSTASGGLTPIAITMEASQGGSHPDYRGIEIDQTSDAITSATANYVGINIAGAANGSFHDIGGYSYYSDLGATAINRRYGYLASWSAAVTPPTGYCDFVGDNGGNTPTSRVKIGCDANAASSFFGPISVADGTGAAGLATLKQGTGGATVANSVGIEAPTSVTAYNFKLPSAQGTGALTNDGSGNTTWTAAGTIPAGNGIPTVNNVGGGAWGPTIPIVPVENYGAVGYTTRAAAIAGTDSTSAIQACLTALTIGQCQLQGLYYKVTSAISITNSSVGLVGVSSGSPLGFLGIAPSASVLLSTSASADIIDVAGTSTSANVSYNRFENFTMSRSVVPTGTAAGLSLNYTYAVVVDHVTSEDSARGFYVHASGSLASGITNSFAIFGYGPVTETAGNYHGFYLDSADGIASPSMMYHNIGVFSNLLSVPSAVTYAFHVNGTSINDIDVSDLNIADTQHGIYLNYTGSGAFDSNSDIHFQNVTIDQAGVEGIYVNTGTSATLAGGAVRITGGYDFTSQAGAVAVTITGSSGVEIGSMQLGGTGPTLQASSSTNLNIHDNIAMDVAGVGFQFSGVTNSNVSNNVIHSVSGGTTALSFDASSTNISGISSNNTSGAFTAPISTSTWQTQSIDQSNSTIEYGHIISNDGNAAGSDTYDRVCARASYTDLSRCTGFYTFDSARTPSGLVQPLSTYFASASGLTGGMYFNTEISGAPLTLATNNTAAVVIDGTTQVAKAQKGIQLPSYTVAGLPSAATLGAGTQVMVTDATTFTPGTCTGGGSDYMIAVSNGSTWSCH